MPEVELALRDVYVQPGESHLVTEPAVVRTILGSCVGVTFWAPRLNVGALCHPMLPVCPLKKLATIGKAAGRRYVDFTIREMSRQLDALGLWRQEVQVKLFGGGDVLKVTSSAARPTVGKMNIEAAENMLRNEGFSIAASSVGGTCGLSIQFYTETGEVLLKRLS